MNSKAATHIDMQAMYSRCSVLLVDDEIEVIEILAEVIEGLGVVVHKATSGAKAIAIAKATPIDVAVLDVRMPEMDGIETLRGLLRHRPNLVAVFLTGHANIQSVREALALGAVDFLDKPIDVPKIEAMARRSVERAWMRRERSVILEALLMEYAKVTPEAFRDLTFEQKGRALQMVRSIVEVKALNRERQMGR